MKILFTADLHSNKEAFQSFVSILDSQEFDVGVIAGDLMEDGVTPQEVIELLNVLEDDLIPELPSADETIEEALQRGIEELHNPEGNYIRTLQIKEKQLRKILYKTEKSILIIRGNHDLTEWKSDRNIYNIHWRRMNFGEYNFVGYQHTEFSRTQEQQRKDFQTLRKHIDSKTVLLTHIPAFGVLDQLIRESCPWLYLHGHIHRPDKLIGDQGISVNGAYPYLNRFYGINVDTREITYESTDTVDLKGVA